MTTEMRTAVGTDAVTEDLAEIYPRVEGYQTLCLIGEGGMGRVFLAEDVILERRVAIKFLHESLAQNTEMNTRFLREARAMASVEHPNIVRVYAFGEGNCGTYLVMEHIEGDALDVRIHRAGPVTEHEALRVVRAVVRALAAAWQKQLVHRDIKPSNILMDTADRIRLTDFGLVSSPVGDDFKSPEAKKIQGTPLYMCPEQARGEPLTDFRGDIYSLGIVLFEMVTGSAPFQGSDPAAIASRHINEPLPDLQSFAAETTPGTVDLCSWMTSKAPSQRPESYGQLEARIGELLAGAGPAAFSAAMYRSIAVLPMVDLSPEGDQQHFCDGLSEEIINALVKIRGLSVSARTSSFRFRDKEIDIRSIGRRLNVDTVLEGSIRTSGDRIRVTAQLIDLATGFHLWSEQYDRELSDIFDVQDEITERIVEAMRFELTAGSKAAIQTSHTRNTQAFDFYLRGRKFFWELTGPSLKIARNMLRRAVEIEPAYALALAALADCCSFLYSYVEQTDAYIEEASSASERALEIDSELCEAHVARGLAMDLAGDFEKSNTHFTKAIALDPTSFDAHYFFGRACLPRGETERAAKLLEKAHELRPDTYLAPQMIRLAYDRLGRHAEATAVAHRTLALVERTLELTPDDTRALYTGAQNAALVGEVQQAFTWAQQILASADNDPAVFYNVACIYSLAGKPDDAIDLFGQAIDAGFSHRTWIETDPDLDPLRSHRAFKRIVASMG